MRNLMTAALLFLLSFPLAAQSAQRFLRPEPDPASISVRKAIEYRPGLRFDLYRPATEEVVPVVVFVNVGAGPYTEWPGYIGWGKAVAGAGMAAVVYQASPSAMTDFDALIAALRRDAESLRIDPSRVVLWSASANVTVGLPLAMDRNRDYIRSAVVYYGDGPAPEIRTDLPVFFVRAGLDSTQLNERIGTLLARALAANAPWTIENYGGGLHGFEIFNDNELTRMTIDRTLEFMKRTVEPASTAAYLASAGDAATGAAFAREDWPTAIAGYRSRLEASPSDGASALRLAIALSRSGSHAESLPLFEKAWQLGWRGPRDTALPAAEAAAGAGDLEHTLHWLEILLSSGFGPTVENIRSGPQWAGVREDPRFASFLSEMEQQVSVMSLLESNESELGLQKIREAKQGRLTREPVLNSMGYRLLNRGRPAEATAVFRIAAQRFARSPNAWDSLADALERTGDRAGAVASSKKALQLLGASRGDADPNAAIRQAATDRLRRLGS